MQPPNFEDFIGLIFIAFVFVILFNQIWGGFINAVYGYFAGQKNLDVNIKEFP